MGRVTRPDDKRLGPRNTCHRGHDDWYTQSNGRRRCRTCERAREARRRAEGRDYKTRLHNATAERCKKGHKNWMISKAGYRQCKTCMKEASEEWRNGSLRKQREKNEKKEQARILAEIARLKEERDEARRAGARGGNHRAHHKVSRSRA